jgi:hypothetical protein
MVLTKMGPFGIKKQGSNMARRRLDHLYGILQLRYCGYLFSHIFMTTSINDDTLGL